MANAFLAETPFLRDVLWQTTLLLFLGLLAGYVWWRQPARAHRLLLLAMIAGVLTPLASFGARRLGWGLWAAQTAPVTPAEPPPAKLDLHYTVAAPPARGFVVADRREDSHAITGLAQPADITTILAESVVETPTVEPALPYSWTAWLAWGWAI